MVTRADLPAPYLAPQAAHAVANFAIHQPDTFRVWHSDSQYIIVLETCDAEELYSLYHRLSDQGAVPFIEPDIMYEMTAFAYCPDNLAGRQAVAHLPLAQGASSNLSKIRRARKLSRTLPHDVDWNPAPTWARDRRNFRAYLGPAISENTNAAKYFGTTEGESCLA